MLREWPSQAPPEQLRLGQLYNSQHNTHVGDKLWNNRQYSTLNVYQKLGATFGAILEEIMEWEGSFDEISNGISAHIPYFYITS